MRDPDVNDAPVQVQFPKVNRKYLICDANKKATNGQVRSNSTLKCHSDQKQCNSIAAKNNSLLVMFICHSIPAVKALLCGIFSGNPMKLTSLILKVKSKLALLRIFFRD